MQAKLTSKAVNSLKAKKSTYKVWDTEIKGFFVRVSPKGAKTYCLFYRINGKARDFTIDKHGKITTDKARAIAKVKLGDVAAGIDIQAVKKDGISKAETAKHQTLKTFVDLKYQPWAEAHLKSAHESIRVLNKDFKHLHSRKLSDITQWDIQKWASNLLKPKGGKEALKPETINRRVAILKAVLSKAVEWGVIERSQLAGTKRLKTDSIGRVRWLTPLEEKALRKALDNRQLNQKEDRESYNRWREERELEPLEALGGTFTDYLKPIVILAINTGMRRGELFNLLWSDINIRKQILTVKGSNAKSGTTRHIPLNNEALLLLKTWRNQTSKNTLVFPSPRTGKRFDNITSSWNSLLKSADITEFHFHDLRHHFASQLVMKSIDLNTVRELLGHSNLDQTLRYAHLAPEHKAAAVALLNN